MIYVFNQMKKFKRLHTVLLWHMFLFFIAIILIAFIAFIGGGAIFLIPAILTWALITPYSEIKRRLIIYEATYERKQEEKETLLETFDCERADWWIMSIGFWRLRQMEIIVAAGLIVGSLIGEGAILICSKLSAEFFYEYSTACSIGWNLAWSLLIIYFMFKNLFTLDEEYDLMNEGD